MQLVADISDDSSVSLNNNGDILINGNELWRGGKKEKLRNDLNNEMYHRIHVAGVNNQGVVAGNITEVKMEPTCWNLVVE